MGFSAGKKHQKLEVLSFCDRERAKPPSITVLTFLMENEYNEVLWGVYLLRIHGKNFKSDFVLVRESKGLYYIFLLLNVIDSKTVCD